MRSKSEVLPSAPTATDPKGTTEYRESMDEMSLERKARRLSRLAIRKGEGWDALRKGAKEGERGQRAKRDGSEQVRGCD